MERSEKLIAIWNGEFPGFPLTLPDLKNPHSMMGAYFHAFSHLGIDIDAVLTPPQESERDDHTVYYWDLLPVINMTRVMNHILSNTEKISISLPLTITHFLQPDQTKSHALLLLLVNLIAFNAGRLKDIEPHVSELFDKRDQVKQLEEMRNRLVGLLNEQAEEKGKRAERLEKLDHDVKQFEEELKQEKEAFNEEKQELEGVLEDLRQTELLLEQKKTHRDALLAEVARKKALRVYDAEDILAQAQQAAQNVQEAEEKLESLKATLMLKENSLMNLQKIKPNLEQANNLLNEVMKLSDSLNEYDNGDFETDSREGELDVLSNELAELHGTLQELRAARHDCEANAADNQVKRQLQRAQLQSDLREAEEQDKKYQEQSKKSQQIIKEMKEVTIQCEQDKQRCEAELEGIRHQFCDELKSFEEELLKRPAEAKRTIEKRLQSRRR